MKEYLGRRQGRERNEQETETSFIYQSTTDRQQTLFLLRSTIGVASGRQVITGHSSDKGLLIHSVDLDYIFYNPSADSRVDVTLAVLMQTYFTELTTTDSPDAAELPIFPTDGDWTVENVNITKLGRMKDQASARDATGGGRGLISETPGSYIRRGMYRISSLT